MTRERAFTLIELLMVVAIISLVSSVLFYNVSEAKKKGEDAHMRAESGEVAKAVYQYQDSNGGQVPGSTSVTREVAHQEGSPEYDTAMQELVEGGFMSEIPYSPSGDDYAYIISEDGTEAVFAADMNYDDGNSSNNSCPLTQGASGDDGGDDEPPCTEPELPPDFNDIYGPYEDYFTSAEYDFPRAWMVYDTAMAPTNETGSCGSYPNLSETVAYGNFQCIDLPSGLSEAEEICDLLTTSWSCNPTAANARAMLYRQNELDDQIEYLTLYEEPYIQAYEEYDQCMIDHADEYDEYGDWIGGGSGDEEESEMLCDGLAETDYCTCI